MSQRTARALVAGVLLAFADPSQGGDRAESLRRLVDAAVEPYVRAASFSGVVRVSRRGVSVERAFGLAQEGSPREVRAGDRFFVASISKSFTAATALRLVDRGILRLDEPIARRVPELPAAAGVTVRQLLEHKAGLPDILRRPDFEQVSQRPFALPQAVGLLAGLPLEFPPGSTSRYSNSSSVVLALVIERAAGRPFAATLRDEVLRPAGLGGMDQTHASVAGRVPVGRRGFAASRTFDRSLLTGAAQMAASAGEIERWMRALEHGPLAGVGARMRKEEWAVGERAVGGRRAESLGGWDGVGFAAQALRVADEDLSVVVLSNLNIASVADEIATLVLKRALGQVAPGLALRTDAPPAAEAPQLAGRYRFGPDFFVPNAPFEIVVDEDGLAEQQHGPERRIGLLWLGGRAYVHRSSWGRVVFEDGNPAPALTLYGRFRAVREVEP